jgi:two-component system, NarL family, response regulator YdfI
MIRVLVASRSSELEQAIRSSPSMEFAGRVDPSQLFSSQLSGASSELHGDILLIEVDDLNEHDWRALAELPIPILLLMDAPTSGPVMPALRAGIRGAIPSDATPQEIESAVHAINAGLVVTTPAFVAELLPETQVFGEELAEPLSNRELEVLDLLAEGLSNKLIAHRLNISEHTVKTHVASIFAKLGASSRTEAVSQAIRRGLVML